MAGGGRGGGELARTSTSCSTSRTDPSSQFCRGTTRVNLFSSKPPNLESSTTAYTGEPVYGMVPGEPIALHLSVLHGEITKIAMMYLP